MSVRRPDHRATPAIPLTRAPFRYLCPRVRPPRTARDVAIGRCLPIPYLVAMTRPLLRSGSLPPIHVSTSPPRSPITFNCSRPSARLRSVDLELVDFPFWFRFARSLHPLGNTCPSLVPASRRTVRLHTLRRTLVYPLLFTCSYSPTVSPFIRHFSHLFRVDRAVVTYKYPVLAS
jgi:hypothetical protein